MGEGDPNDCQDKADVSISVTLPELFMGVHRDCRNISEKDALFLTGVDSCCICGMFFLELHSVNQEKSEN